MKKLLKVSSLSILTVLYSVNTWALPQPVCCHDGGVYNCDDGGPVICSQGIFCSSEYSSDLDFRYVSDEEAMLSCGGRCPSNYDNTATGLKSIEECCLHGYDSATGLCKSAGPTLYNDTISESCKADFLGSSSGNALNSFAAEYTPNNYTVAAGQYLAKNTVAGTQCPANSYCAGGEYTFSETSDSGITSCPSDFALSAAGTSSVDSCYHACTASDIVNASKVASVTGGTVTAGGTNTCAATCITGYTFKAAGADTNPLSGKENIDADRGSSGYTRLDGTGGSKEADFGLTPGSGEWAVEFSHGTIKGQALCSTQSGTSAYSGATEASQVSTAASLTPGIGTYDEYCWCKITGYTPTGSNTMQSLSSPWVLHRYEGVCGNACSLDCATTLSGEYGMDSEKLIFRTALFGNVSTKAACVANEINVNWYDGETLHATNQCTYDGDITLPTAPTKTGYTFSGWKLVTGSSNE